MGGEAAGGEATGREAAGSEAAGGEAAGGEAGMLGARLPPRLIRRPKLLWGRECGALIPADYPGWGCWVRNRWKLLVVGGHGG